MSCSYLFIYLFIYLFNHLQHLLREEVLRAMQASQYKREIEVCPIFNVHQCDPYWYWKSFAVFQLFKNAAFSGSLRVVKNPNKNRLVFHLKIA